MNINNSRGIPEKKKRRGLLLFQIFIVIGFLAAMWFSFGQNVLAPQNSAVPERWQKLELVSTIEGEEALASVNRLHGTEISLVSVYVADYARGTEGATAWVGQAVNKETAAELLEIMVRGIARGGAGFTNLQGITINGQEAFQVDGPGGAHFFYIPREQPDRVVWLTVNAADVLPILETAIKIF
jgi:hypothetical protein